MARKVRVVAAVLLHRQALGKPEPASGSRVHHSGGITGPEWPATTEDAKLGSVSSADLVKRATARLRPAWMSRNLVLI